MQLSNAQWFHIETVINALGLLLMKRDLRSLNTSCQRGDDIQENMETDFDCDTDHCLVDANIRYGLSVNKQVIQNF